MLTSISLALGWWSPRALVKFHQPMNGWGGCSDGGPRRRFNVKELLSEARAIFTDRHQQTLHAIEGESEDKGWHFKRNQDSGLYLKGLEGAEDTLSLCKTQERQEDDISPHVEVKEFKLKSQGVPKRVDFKYVFALLCTQHYP